MSRFKEAMIADLATIINLDEFAEMHNINGKDLPCIIDADICRGVQRQADGQTSMNNGLYQGHKVLFIRKSDIETSPVAGEILTLDGEINLVNQSIESDGLLEITLEANED